MNDLKIIAGCLFLVFVSSCTNTGNKSSAIVNAPADSAQVVTFPAEGGISVYADLYELGDRKEVAPTLLLLHQAGSNGRGEYGFIIPELIKLGANVMALDLRNGGDALGGENRTVGLLDGRDFSYCEAYEDVVSAVHFLRKRKILGPIFVWGSSYSGALAVKFAAQNNSEVSGYIAFSPASGPPVEGCEPEPFIEKAGPGIVFRPENEMAHDWIVNQFDEFSGHGVEAIVVKNGVHGSSMLNDARTGRDMSQYRQHVYDFIHRNSLRTEQNITIESEGWVIHGEYRGGLRSSTVGSVLMLNQAGGNRGDYEGLATAFASKSIASLRIDLRGHGDSINLGRFRPNERSSRAILQGSHNDAAAAHRILAKFSGADIAESGVVGASYSGEEMVKAANATGFAKAYVGLSPGSLSEESIMLLDGSGARWLFVKAEQEHSFFNDLFEEIEANSEVSETITLPGKGHATGLLATHAELAGTIANWFYRVFTTEP